MTFQVGANAADTLDRVFADIESSMTTGFDWTSTGSVFSLSCLGSSALANLDTAIKDVSSQAATLGAVQNRLQYTSDAISATETNLSSSNSRIKDVDMASEMTTMTQEQILQQAGTSMLAQANSAPPAGPQTPRLNPPHAAHPRVTHLSRDAHYERTTPRDRPDSHPPRGHITHIRSIEGTGKQGRGPHTPAPARALQAYRAADHLREMPRLMMTSFGFNDAGGGTTVPRLTAKELAARGWEVTVFHAAAKAIAGGRPYEVSEWTEDGVSLIGVHNRSHGLFDLGHPHREIDDPPISAAFAAALDRVGPDVVHFHNLHNLGASLLDHAGARGLPAYFSTHNYWLICPRAYLLDGQGAICPGPGEGSRCASCTGSRDVAGHQRRLAEIRDRAQHNLTAILTVSEAVRHALLGAGYPAGMLDLVRQAMPHEASIWSSVGAARRPGRAGDALTVAFLGSAYPHKGPQLLVAAAQQTQADVRVRILGEVQERFAARLGALDGRGVVDVSGAFAPEQIGELLRGVDAVVLPSLWWDCAPLAAAECLAARTPLLVPRLGGLPESIREGVDGLTFEALDAGDLARQLDRLACEPGLLERLQAGIQAPRAFSAYIDELEAYYAGERPGARREPASAPAVRWQGEHGAPNSLSIINDRVTERLPGPVQRVRRDGSALDGPLLHPADIEVRHQWPPDLSAPPSGRLVILQPWEFGAIPRSWIGPLAGVDELWVPSEYVRVMYVAAGVDPERVVVIPNGVDLSAFAPAQNQRPDGPVRFLFVGGLIGRKGPDILLEAWQRAFVGRDDVELVVKDFGGRGIYRDGLREPIQAWAASGQLPRVTLIDEEMSLTQLADLYRSCDVFVAPYRGEGFAMPVLEAMACGLPVITTAGGPTDEFCPPQAGWRIAAQRGALAAQRIGDLDTVGHPWVLEPSGDDLVRLMLEAVCAGPDGRRRRGAAGRAAAQALSWDAVAARYGARLADLAGRDEVPARVRADIAPLTLSEDVRLRVLATPAWQGTDRLGELLRAWSDVTEPSTSACLYLLADPQVAGTPAQLEAFVVGAAAAAGADLECCGDINVLMEPMRAGLDRSVHAAVDAFVPLHGGCVGHERLALEAGNVVVGVDGLAGLLERAGQSGTLVA